ncbi:MAG: ATP-binding cassette domain-containing protein, partial [Actinomycetota bacterium]|nr:ATP-binding cassette domain-containing protein [Actinomycetota bacterium]
MTPLLTVENLTVSFRRRGRAERPTACRQVSFHIDAGETVGLVGGSGAGKSTIARAVVGLVRPNHGRIIFDGTELRPSRRGMGRWIHLVFQDPYASLPPTLTVASIVAEPLLIHRLAARDRRQEIVAGALTAVHLTPAQRFLPRYPHQLSGGERQRVAFARALVTRPRVILADEPTQMLDGSLRAELADLLGELRSMHGVAVLHITHDLALAQRSCDRLVVLQAGQVVEQGATGVLLSRPEHPYTAALIDAARALCAPR